jgi:hypothetical protein
MENILQKEPTYLTPNECAHQFADDLLEVCLFFFY